jgi:RNA polymerase sigma-70 factor, ECF subfamily
MALFSRSRKKSSYFFDYNRAGSCMSAGVDLREVAMPTRSDNLALVERIIGGDEDAAQEFESKYRPRFENRSRRAGIPIQDCADVAQEVFFSAIGQLQRGLFRGDSSLGTWLDKIVSGKIGDYLRSHREEKQALLSSRINEDRDEIALVERLPSVPIDHIVVLSVRQALERMPTELRVILVLKRCEGRTLEDIGRGLKRSSSAVYRKLIEAEETFRMLIAAESEEGKTGPM